MWTPAEYAAKPGWGARLPSTLRHAPGGRARGGGQVGLALAALTHFPETLARR